jgi:4'-phosphopantetheinyl transferase
MTQELFTVPPTEVETPVDGEVHVWGMRVDAFDGDGAQQAWLSADERLRASRLRFEADRRRFVAARCALRGILSLYDGRHPEDIRFCYSRGWKPELETPAGPSSLRFNVSHSGTLALCAVANGRRIGVDVEHVCLPPSADAIVDRIFSPREREEYYGVPERQRPFVFFRVWTLKEAFVKAVGAGLNRLLGEPESVLDLQSRVRPQTVGRNRLVTQAWSAVELAPDPEYMATAVVEGDVQSVRCWEWRWASSAGSV